MRLLLHAEKLLERAVLVLQQLLLTRVDARHERRHGFLDNAIVAQLYAVLRLVVHDQELARQQTACAGLIEQSVGRDNDISVRRCAVLRFLCQAAQMRVAAGI